MGYPQQLEALLEGGDFSWSGRAPGQLPQQVGPPWDKVYYGR